METTKFLAAVLAVAMVFTLFAGFPMGASAASMTDATFFAKLNYSAYPDLAAVEAAVEKGDYTTAKQELLKYFKERHQNGEITGFGVSDTDENYGMAVLPMRNILTGPYEFDMWQAEFTVTSSSFASYEIDVTDRVASELGNGAVSFMLFAGDKQQYPVYVKSKETSAAPTLRISYVDAAGFANTIEVEADNDTYISSQNTSTTYGSEETLVIKEDGSGSDSTGTNTRRTYINFPLADAANSTITSAVLVLEAAYASDCTTGDKDVLVINVGDTIWSEDELTWAGTRGNIYSYQDAEDPTWAASAPNCDSEYHNVTSRFWFGKPMAYEYLSYLADPDAYNASHPYSDVYPGEEFGAKLIDLMDAFATQMSYGYTRTLETGERLNRWVDIVDAFLGTDVFDDRLDEFVNILSFMWGDCNYLNGLSISDGSVWWSNWRIVANAGFFKAVEFLPEFSAHDTWREKVEYNVEYTLDLLYNDDMSFTEAGPSYNAWCVKLFGDCIRAAEMSGNPMSEDFKGRVRYAARNALESYYPDGYDSNIGDSNYRDQMYYFETLDEIYNKKDSIIHSYVTGSDQGAEYLTSYYPDVNSAYMRSSWDPDETVYINFTNNPNDGHYHPDSNQVLLYAYGKPLLVDSGRYSYSSTNDIYTQLRYASAHNTIEAVGVSMAAHSSAGQAFGVWSTNDTFDFASSTQNGYSGVEHTRNVFYLREGYAIVTDYVAGSDSAQEYRQNWHFMPSNNAVMSANVAQTDFFNDANITVAAASADDAQIRSGYHSADYGLVASSEYASYSKTGATVKFDTVLYPTKAGESASITVTDLAEDDPDKAAIQISGDVNGLYYVKNSEASDGTIANASTDAKMLYMEADGRVMAAQVKSIELDGEALISSPALIDSIDISLENGVLYVTGENLAAAKTEDSAIKMNISGVTSVVLNGEEISLLRDSDGYIVSVASAQPEGDVIIDGVGYNYVGDNLVENGSFETGLDGWYTWNGSSLLDASTQSAISRSTDYSVDGDYSIVTSSTNGGSVAGANIVGLFNLNGGDAVEEDKTYVLSFYRYGNGGSGMTATMGLSSDASGVTVDEDCGGTGNSGTSSVSCNLTSLPTNSWHELSYLLTAKAGESVAAEVYLRWCGGQYFDNFTLYEVEASESLYSSEPATVTVKYVDTDSNEIAQSDEGIEAQAGEIYTASVPETITSTVDGRVYIFNSAESYITTKIVSGENVLTAVYDKSADSSVTINYVDENGVEFAQSGEELVPYGTTVDESSITFEETIIIDDTAYLFQEASGFGVTADGTAMEVTLIYEAFGVETTTLGISRGDSLRCSVGDFTYMSSETSSEYSARLMLDNRWYKRAGVFGVDISGEVISAVVSFHINDSSSTNGAFNLIDVTDELGTEWTRGSITGLDLSGNPSAYATVSGSYITYDITDLVNSGSSEFGLTTSGSSEYVILDSENTSSAPVVTIKTIKNKTISAITPPDDITVKYAAELTLPETVKATVDSSDASLNISSFSPAASDISTRTAGEVEVTAEVEIPEHYVLADGVSSQVKFTVTVLPESDPVTLTPFGSDTISAVSGQVESGIYEFGGTVSRTATIEFDIEINTVSNTLIGINNSANMTTNNYFAGSSVFMLINNGKLVVRNGTTNDAGISVSDGDSYHIEIITDVEADTFDLVIYDLSTGDVVYSVSDYAYRTSTDALDCLVAVDNSGVSGAYTISDLTLTTSSFTPQITLTTTPELRIITDASGDVELGIAFTTQFDANINLIEAAGYDYGAAAQDENGNYTIESMDLDTEFDALSTDSFRLTIKSISNLNSVRDYSAQAYVTIGGEKFSGEITSASLYSVLVESIVTGQGTVINPNRLKAANEIIAFVGYGNVDTDKFPSYASAAEKLFNSDGTIKDEYAAYGISLDGETSAMAVLFGIEEVEIEFAGNFIEEFQSDASDEVEISLSFTQVM